MSDMNPYRAMWDGYAKNWKRGVNPKTGLGEDTWPGDEWGNEETWSKIFETMFLDCGATDWKNCVEIGPGSGKYTALLLQSSDSNIIAFDISSEYMEVMKNRLSQYIEEHRVEQALIKAEKSAELLEHLEKKGLGRKLDAFFSIDAMVHVDLQYLIAYFITAALTLKENGLMIMTLANAVSRKGFKHLLNGIRSYYHLQGQPSAKFEYLSPDILNMVLGQMGFQVNYKSPFGNGIDVDRDLYVVAKLVDIGRAETFRAAVSS
jgi:phospholipid N-methyltransferase